MIYNSYHSDDKGVLGGEKGEYMVNLKVPLTEKGRGL
jgi:hypothetical protein